jgi:hypothetical protein
VIGAPHFLSHLAYIASPDRLRQDDKETPDKPSSQAGAPERLALGQASKPPAPLMEALDSPAKRKGDPTDGPVPV